jgi:heme oxygenase
MRLDSWACAKKNLTALTPTQVLGWIFTATAFTLGAPFWFDLLQKFVNVRGAGGRPKREDEKVK